jgi:hypothetical protein
MQRPIRRRPGEGRWRIPTFIVGVTLFCGLMTIPVYWNNYRPSIRPALDAGGAADPVGDPAVAEPPVVVLATTVISTPATLTPTLAVTIAPTLIVTTAATVPPTATALPPTATFTPTQTVSPTRPLSATATATAVATSTISLTPTATITGAQRFLPTATDDNEVENTATATPTPTTALTSPEFLTETATLTATAPVSVALLLVPTATPTPQPTPTVIEPPTPTPAPTANDTPTPEAASPAVVAAGVDPQISPPAVTGQLDAQEKHYIPLTGIDPNLSLTVEMQVDPPTHAGVGTVVTLYIVSQADWQEITSGGIHPRAAHRAVGRAEGLLGRIRANISQPTPPYYVIVVNDSQEPAAYTLSISNGAFGE